MDFEKLEKILSENNQPRFRLEQIKKAIYQDGVSSFVEISNLPKDLREKLSEQVEILPFKVEKVLESKDKNPARNATHSVAGGSFKALLKLDDTNLLESVLMSPKPGMWSVCISTQVGCPLGCGFCATGKGGFKRNLTAEEIVGQVLFWKQHLRKLQNQNSKFQINTKFENKNPKIENCKLKIENSHIGNVVYMGMGEPFLNWEETKKSLAMLNDSKLFNLGSRNISVSTSGIPEGIANLAQDFSQVNLALSLHFADDEKRSQWMPINQKYNLEALREALKKYFELSNRKVFLEYIMLSGINDSLEDAKKLAEYVRSIGKLQLLHVNLIRYNATDNNLVSSSGNKTQIFKNFLEDNRISVTIRKSLGEEIQGACGQLAGK